jgi:protein-S-isoprenylcysteine O-methyltransferase Ste14
VWVVAAVVGERLLEDAGGRTPAILLAILGVLVSAAGIFGFGTAKTTVDPHNIDKASTLVTGGIYRLTRNPMYLGMLLVLLGFARSQGSLIALVVGCGAYIAVITRLQIIPEERFLAKKFGKKYKVFTERTRRWI